MASFNNSIAGKYSNDANLMIKLSTGESMKITFKQVYDTNVQNHILWYIGRTLTGQSFPSNGLIYDLVSRKSNQLIL